MLSEERKRETQVNIRLSLVELSMLSELEIVTGENKSVMVRRWIRTAYKKECPKSMKL